MCIRDRFLGGWIISLRANLHWKSGTYWEDLFLTFRQSTLYTPKGQRFYKLGRRVSLAGFLLIACWVIFFLQSWE